MFFFFFWKKKKSIKKQSIIYFELYPHPDVFQRCIFDESLKNPWRTLAGSLDNPWRILKLFTSSYIPTLIFLRDVYLTHSFSILHVQRCLSEHTRTHTHTHAHTEETADQGKRRRQGRRTGRKRTTGIPQATTMHPHRGGKKRPLEFRKPRNGESMNQHRGDSGAPEFPQ